ncbi:L,D-transpeptidase family protein [Catenuloplanes indicus]|uniref:Lipoprotein-anchoring transpeptidase ErfK/SrfK n=1 Tax=Catenuloplanes indicus TaxID=137267 RepID=A0AAE3VUW2_9ACTN|nr:L,D-transpeptidase family protein [Catenuloplanes indicus]MDQ0363779.1 lipoprotein-anchoring transpeptidase ErfK/SrfK [Catenuloplanes indicus]
MNVRRAAVLGFVIAMAGGCGGGPGTPVAQPGGTGGPPVPPSAVPGITGSPTPGSPAPGALLPPPASASPAVSVPPWSPLWSPPRSSSSSPSLSPGATPAAGADGVLERGEAGPDILALQRRLDALGYWNGPADGSFGQLTMQAVYAVQKAAGLERTGRADAGTLAALAAGVRPAARSRTGHRVEIDLDRQLLLLADDGAVTKIFNTSTGSNEFYRHQGRRYLADTPAGRFRVGRQIDAWRYGPLGPLYRPKYFNGGIAVHGAHDIPPRPASHGCARLSIAAMDWLWTNGAMPVGTRVWVY